jgi:glyceraldehyde-3-phosphate dehydrogenase (NAD(P))
MSSPVAVVGYGVLGRRVASALGRQPDMELAGVIVNRASHASVAAAMRCHRLFGEDGRACDELAAAGLPCAGDADDLLAQSEAVVDCGPSRTAHARMKRYRAASVRIALGGGEPAELAEATFCASANYHDARGRVAVRVASCNVTGLARLLAPLHRRWGVRAASAALVRCAADPDKAAKGVVDGADIDAGASHHAEDVRRVLPGLRIHTQAITVPMTQGHVAMVTVELATEPSAEEVESLYASTPRIVLSELERDSTGAAAARGHATGRERGDRPEVLLYSRSLTVSDRALHLMACIHMESIVVPDTIDCVRAQLAPACEPARSLSITDRALGLEVAGRRYETVTR